MKYIYVPGSLCSGLFTNMCTHVKIRIFYKYVENNQYDHLCPKFWTRLNILAQSDADGKVRIYMVQLSLYIRTYEGRVTGFCGQAGYVIRTEAIFIKKVAFACSLTGLNFFDTLCCSDKQSHKILIKRFIDDLLIYGF